MPKEREYKIDCIVDVYQYIDFQEPLYWYFIIGIYRYIGNKLSTFSGINISCKKNNSVLFIYLYF